jgi:hypothetical protein
MWNVLRKGGEIHLFVSMDQANAVDYLSKRIGKTSNLNVFSVNAGTGLSFFGLFLLNIKVIFSLWFKYPKIAQLDELSRLYKNLEITKLSEGAEVCYLLK